MNSSAKLICHSLQNTLQRQGIQDLVLSMEAPNTAKDMALLISCFYFHLCNGTDCIRKF